MIACTLLAWLRLRTLGTVHRGNHPSIVENRPNH